MPIQQLAPPTLNEINQELAQFEGRFHISTEEFLASEQHGAQIDEDDAVQWLFLVEQRRVLRANPYLRSETGKSLKNCYSVLDRLAA